MDIKNPVKAIRAKCLDCCCNSKKEVELCTCEKCSLHPFRFGKNPYREKKSYVMTPEQREQARQSMLKINSERKSVVKQTVKADEPNHG